MNGIYNRFLKINEQNVIIHLPDRPNGFAILLIGDVNHFVTDQTSSWLQHPERANFIEQLRSSGYMVIYSNLYGRHWGNDLSTELLYRIYLTIIKQEIMNERIHILAEGMGALSALKWMENHKDITRSAAFINPCLSLKVHGEAVREQKLFYKQFHREISRAYKLSEEEVDRFLLEDPGIHQYTSTLPVKIWHHMQATPYSFMKHSRAYEKYREELGSPIFLTIQLTGTKHDFSQKVRAFYQLYEKDL
jgi:hypothetical protein